MSACLRVHLIAWIALASSIVGCATSEKAPVEKDKRPAEAVQRAPSEQHIVFGKLKLVRDGKPAKIKKLGTFSVSGMAALVLPETSNTALSLDVDEQGWFAWGLKPGTYTLLGFVTIDRNSTQFTYINGRFSVHESEPVVYIGQLNVDLSGSELDVALRDEEIDAFSEIRKRYSDVQSPAKRLLEASKIGSYAHRRSVCDPQWGLQCNRDGSGAKPVEPVLTRGLRGSTFTRVNTVSPAFKWQSASNGARYDIAIWEAATYRVPNKLITNYTPGHLVHYEESVSAAEFVLSKPLKPKTKYYWSVRCRNGNTVSTWSRAGHFTFMFVMWSSGYGEWFAFETS